MEQRVLMMSKDNIILEILAPTIFLKTKHKMYSTHILLLFILWLGVKFSVGWWGGAAQYLV
jgi:hypothetical protein